VAREIGLGLDVAVRSAGLAFKTSAFPGLGLTPEALVDPVTKVPEDLGWAAPLDVVIVQLSLWDVTASSDAQVSGIERFYQVMQEYSPGSVLVIIDSPPVVWPPEAHGQQPRYLESAKTAAAAHPGGILVLDSAAVWGDTFVRDMNGDGVPERKADGIHLCPTGVALVSAWIVSELATLFNGVTPDQTLSWAAGDWTTDPLFNEPTGTCVL
jgi:hypothetical protein